MLGRWKNFDELEELLTLKELEAIIEALREQKQSDQRFAAALQGVNLNENEGEETGDAIVRKAEAEIARRTGKTPDGVPEDLATLGSSKEGFGVGMGLGYATEL